MFSKKESDCSQEEWLTYDDHGYILLCLFISISHSECLCLCLFLWYLADTFVQINAQNIKKQQSEIVYLLKWSHLPSLGQNGFWVG